MSTEPVAELRRKRYNATVEWLHKVHSDLMLIRVRPDFPLPTHAPGQFGTLGLGYWEPRHPGCQAEELPPTEEQKLVRRAYSISCPVLEPSDPSRLFDRDAVNWLEYYIVLVRESDKPKPPALTPRLFMLRPGDRLFMGEKIAGHFTAEGVKPTHTVLFLSTGTGEAPHNYLLWELLRRGHQGRMLAACCVRYRRDLAYLPLQEELMRRSANYTYLALTTREAGVGQHKVYIQDLLSSGKMEQILGKPLDPATTHVFLCGNPNMIGVPTKDRVTGLKVYPATKGVIEILEQRGFQIDQPAVKMKGNIHFEEYW